MQVIVSEYKSIHYGIISHYYIRQDDKDNYISILLMYLVRNVLEIKYLPKKV